MLCSKGRAGSSPASGTHDIPDGPVSRLGLTTPEVGIMTFWRMAMTPVVRAWMGLRRSALDYVPRPDGVAQAHSGGHNADRILLFGSGIVVGWGVATHDIGLAGSLAREVTRRTGRAVDIEVIADPRLSVTNAVTRLRELNLRRYDAMVIYVGENDALRLTAVSEWSRRLAALLDYVGEQSSPEAPLFLVGIQNVRSIATYDSWLGSIANSQATRMNAITRELCAARATAHFVPITSPESTAPARLRDGRSYGHWASEIADVVAPLLGPSRPADEVAGQAISRDTAESEPHREISAVDLGRVDEDTDGKLRQIVGQARAVFNGSGAGLGLFAGDRIVFPIRAGDVPEQVELRGSFGEETIAARDALIVPDAAADARFDENTNVLGELGVRFWAGFPIERVTGERIGLLCVFGHEPRASNPSWDRTVLRQLALAIQRQLGASGE
jgi:hypothetical protein